jgi:hypothetical protein
MGLALLSKLCLFERGATSSSGLWLALLLLDEGSFKPVTRWRKGPCDLLVKGTQLACHNAQQLVGVKGWYPKRFCASVDKAVSMPWWHIHGHSRLQVARFHASRRFAFRHCAIPKFNLNRSREINAKNVKRLCAVPWFVSMYA